VFGVACQVPPPLTIVILNGCFSFPIGSYLLSKLYSLKNQTFTRTYCLTSCCSSNRILPEEEKTLTGEQTDQEEKIFTAKKKMSTYVLTLIETVAFFIQVSVLILIPGLLVTKKDSISVTILIPFTLIFLSFVWSGWVTTWFKVITVPKKKESKADSDEKEINDDNSSNYNSSYESYNGSNSKSDDGNSNESDDGSSNKSDKDSSSESDKDSSSESDEDSTSESDEDSSSLCDVDRSSDDDNNKDRLKSGNEVNSNNSMSFT